MKGLQGPSPRLSAYCKAGLTSRAFLWLRVQPAVSSCESHAELPGWARKPLAWPADGSSRFPSGDSVVLQPNRTEFTKLNLGAVRAACPGFPGSSVCHQTALHPSKLSSCYHLFHEVFPDFYSPRQHHLLPQWCGRFCILIIQLHLRSHQMAWFMGERTVFY